MEDSILFPPSSLFEAGFIVVPKRMHSPRIYKGYQTLVTYPTTFFKEGEIAGYLFFLLYRDAENRRSCHFSSVTCKNTTPEEVVNFITSFCEEAEIEHIVVEDYSPPPVRGQCVFPYSEVLVALPANTEISASLKRAKFTETVRIPCFEFVFTGNETSCTVHPYQNTQEELQFYWREWIKNPEALKIRGRELKQSFFIDTYLYNFPLFSSLDMVLFGDKGVVHWFPDIAPCVTETLEPLYSSLTDIKVKRAKLFRAAGEKRDDLLEQAMQYIHSHYTIERFQLDNCPASLIELLKDKEIISQCTLLYERVIFSYPG